MSKAERCVGTMTIDLPVSRRLSARELVQHFTKQVEECVDAVGGLNRGESLLFEVALFRAYDEDMEIRVEAYAVRDKTREEELRDELAKLDQQIAAARRDLEWAQSRAAAATSTLTQRREQLVAELEKGAP